MVEKPEEIEVSFSINLSFLSIKIKHKTLASFSIGRITLIWKIEQLQEECFVFPAQPSSFFSFEWFAFLQQSIFSLDEDISLLQHDFPDFISHADAKLGIKKKPNVTISNSMWKLFFISFIS